jgi:glycosyltransferase involved in cell wall biosynthesis
MTKNRVAALTQTFPFGNGETFIDDEALAWESNPTFDVVWFPSVEENEQRFKLAEFVRPEMRILMKVFLGLRYFPWDATLFELRALVKLSPSQFIRKASLLIRHGMQAGVRIGCLMRQKRFDVYYSYWATPDAVAAQRVARRRGAISIVRSHRSDIYEGVASEYLPYRRFLSSISGQPTRHVYLCDSARDFADIKFGSSPSLIAPLGISDSIGLSVANKVSYPLAAPFNFVSASHFSAVKRLDKVADVLNILFEKGFVSSWHHFGGDSSDTGSLVQTLDIKFKEKVVFHGFVPNQEFRRQMNILNNSIFMNLSTSEGMPVTVMEAMAAGMPIVATEVGCVSELVRPQMGLLLSAESSTEDLSAEIANWLSTFNFEIGVRSAIEQVASHFQAKTNHKRFIAAVEELI